MQPDTFTGKTFEALLLDFSEQAGLASYPVSGGAAAIPQSTHDLAKCKRFINKGYELFLRSDPDWTFIHAPWELRMDPTGAGPLNINQDSSRYRLPSYLNHAPVGNLRYSDDNTYLTQCVIVTPDTLERNRQLIDRTGTPAMCAVRRIASANPVEQGGSEIVFYPTPDTAYVVRGTFRIGSYELRELGERHVAGSDHDHAILSAAMHLWAQADGVDAEVKAYRLQEWTQALEASRAIDKRKRVKNRGQMREAGTQSDPAGIVTHDRALVTTRNGVPIP
jgi:hypothetical protein